jgi:L-arabinose isomerase
MRPRLERYQHVVEDCVRGFGSEVVSAGLVDTPEGARAAGQLFLREDVDLILCYVATYAMSSQVNLQPSAALDYETADTAEWLANCSVCCVPEGIPASGEGDLKTCLAMMMMDRFGARTSC